MMHPFERPRKTWLLLLAMTALLPAQDRPGPAPALPFVAKNVCPFEGCAYRSWTARQDMPIFDAWGEGRHPVGIVRRGETVTGLGGVVVTYRPGTIRVDRDVPEAALKAGDSILTYSDFGEGYSQVWFNGHYHESFDITFTKWPDGTGCGNGHCAATYIDLGKKLWFAQLKMKSGVTGWVDMDDALFNGVNMLAAQDARLTLPTARR